MTTQLPPAGHRLVFVGGLHRSGTSPVARWLGAHPEVSSFTDTGVHEDEGQHLQDVYLPARSHGGPGRFALDANAHLTETSALVSASSKARLWASWSRYWDLSKPVLLEKSPPNLLRMRFLQALFPGSRFVVVVRHPIAVAYATRKWSRAPVRTLLRNWVVAHEILLEDSRFVDAVRLLRYEDLVSDPDAVLAQVFSFLDLADHHDEREVRRDVNRRYLASWPAIGANPLRRAYGRHMQRSFSGVVERFGYSLRDPYALESPAPELAQLFGASG